MSPKNYTQALEIIKGLQDGETTTINDHDVTRLTARFLMVGPVKLTARQAALLVSK
jgi:hypothetical protein